MPAGRGRSVGICILGCGRIARRHGGVLRSLAARPRLFFASRSADKAERYRKTFSGEAAFGSYEEALADERVDAVVICTPHDLHLEHVRLAAAHGVHVLLEKPMARTVQEADEIIRLVEESRPKAGKRSVLMVAENFRYKPSVQRVRRLLDEGIVGCLKCVRVQIASLAKHGGWRREPERMGGGALLDGGIHWVDTLLCWAGPPRRVMALQGMKTQDALPLEDTMHVVSEHEGGIVSELSHSWGIPSPGPLQFSHVAGTEGTLYIENHGYFLYRAGRRRGLFIPRQRDRSGFGGMHEDFHRCVAGQVANRADALPVMTGAEGRLDLAFVLAAYQSAREGRVVSLSEPGG